MASLKKRGTQWYAQYYLGRTQKRISLQTTSYQIAKEKLRRLESGLAQGDDNPLPSRTPIAEVLTAYVEHVRTIKTAKSAQTDIYYLREAFGLVCEGLKITSRIVTEASRKRCLKAEGAKKPRPTKPIEAACFEQITTAQFSEFIAGKVRSRELAPKTANDVVKWFKPSRGDFRIYYSNDPEYVPDFAVEAKSAKYLCEPKAADEMKDPVVLAKAEASATWCAYASKHEEEIGGKPWSYLLIPHDKISENMTLKGLAAAYTVKPKVLPIVTVAGAAQRV